MSVPSLASNRANVFNLEIQDLTTELNDLSAYVYSLSPSGGVSQAEFNDLSSFTYTNINAIVPELTTISNDVDNLFALVNALDVSGISGFIILNDLSKEVFEISDRMLVIENDFISLSGSLNVRVTDISQGLDALTTTVGGFQGEINSISNELNDLSQFVYGLPSGDVTQAQFQTLSGFVRSNALLTSRVITNGSYVGTFNQSGSTASFQAINSTGNVSVGGNVSTVGNVSISGSITTDGFVRCNDIIPNYGTTIITSNGTSSPLLLSPAIPSGMNSCFYINRRPNDGTPGSLAISLPPLSPSYLGTTFTFVVSGSLNANFDITFATTGTDLLYVLYRYNGWYDVGSQGQTQWSYKVVQTQYNAIESSVRADATNIPLKGLLLDTWGTRNYNGDATTYNATRTQRYIIKGECIYWEVGTSGVPQLVWFLYPYANEYIPYAPPTYIPTTAGQD